MMLQWLLCYDLHKLILELISLIVKSSVIQKSKNFCKIEFDNKENLLSLNLGNIGFAAKRRDI